MTFDIIEDGQEKHLRIVPSEEVTRDFLGNALAEDEEAEEDGEGSSTPGEKVVESKNNRDTIDDSSSQKLTAEEIEALKSIGGNAGKEIIEKILSNHTELHKKTTFSLHKYTARKRAKYLKRFTVLPVDVAGLLSYMVEEKDARSVLEMRNEHLGLILSLANVRWGGRYLIVDETGGIVVGAVAERLGILHAEESTADESTEASTVARPSKKHSQPLASTNTITLLHPNEQPNLSLLKYFQYDLTADSTNHPLEQHLKPLTYLQLLHPELEPTITEVPLVSDAEFKTLKSNKKTSYLRKRRRYIKMESIISDTQRGEFDALIIASNMLQDLEWFMKNLVPLVRGSGQVVVFSPNREPLVNLVEKYSTLRRSEWVRNAAEGLPQFGDLDPTLLLSPTIHSTAERRFQVLPGRTHPRMTQRGGAEGYVFHAIKVIPVEGKVSGRGLFEKKKRRKLEEEEKEYEEIVGEALEEIAKEEDGVQSNEGDKMEL